MKWFQNLDQFKWTVIIVCLTCLVYGSLMNAVLTLVVWMVRDEIIIPYFYKKEDEPIASDLIQSQIDDIQRELNALKISSAMRTLS